MGSRENDVPTEHPLRISHLFPVVAQARNLATKRDTTDRERTGFVLLPAEIRLQIMEYVLAPGEIRLRPAFPSCPETTPNLIKKGVNNVIEWHRRAAYACKYGWTDYKYPNRIPGIQLLATCKQAFDEVRRLVFSSLRSYLYLSATTKGFCDTLEQRGGFRLQRDPQTCLIPQIVVRNREC